MKKFALMALILVLLPIFNLNFANASNFSSEFVVVSNTATIFEAADLSSERLITLSHKDVVLIETEQDKPIEYNNEFLFFKAQFGTYSGYIVADLVVPKNNVIESVPNFNAKTNSTCKVYEKKDAEFVESKIDLQRHHKIFLYEGFDKKKEFTAICFLHNNQIYYGYLETDKISPNGINPTIITCICIIIAVVGIVFAWVFMKNKKSK